MWHSVDHSCLIANGFQLQILSVWSLFAWVFFLRIHQLPPTVQKHPYQVVADSKLPVEMWVWVPMVVCQHVALWWTGSSWSLWSCTGMGLKGWTSFLTWLKILQLKHLMVPRSFTGLKHYYMTTAICSFFPPFYWFLRVIKLLQICQKTLLQKLFIGLIGDSVTNRYLKGFSEKISN